MALENENGARSRADYGIIDTALTADDGLSKPNQVLGKTAMRTYERDHANREADANADDVRVHAAWRLGRSGSRIGLD